MPGVVSLLEAIMGTHVDLKGLEEGIKKAERLAEDGAKRIAEHFGLVGIGIATALTGAILGALEQAIKKTAEWGLRSEEHTSELQSLRHLVCRLLLEKKKTGRSITEYKPPHTSHTRVSTAHDPL